MRTVPNCRTELYNLRCRFSASSVRKGMTVKVLSAEKVGWLHGFVLFVNQYQSSFSSLFKNGEEFASSKQNTGG